MLLLVSTALPVFAQTTGQIEGTVADPAGAVIKGARVTVTGPNLIAPAHRPDRQGDRGRHP